MKDIVFSKDIREQEELRVSFNQLAEMVFSISFEKWYQKGGWDDCYIPYSVINEQKVVSNASANVLIMRYQGHDYHAIQIGTVMTHPNYRKLGYASQLTRNIMEDYEDKCDLFYLFPEENAISFYESLGFELIHDVIFSIELKRDCKENASLLRQLNMEELSDYQLLVDLLGKRVSNSDFFNITDSKAICLWYCTGLLSERIYYCPSEKAIVLYKIENESLHLYDFISENSMRMDDLLKVLSHEVFSKVIFYFTPGDEILKMCTIEQNEPMMIKSKGLVIDSQFSYPFTARA